MAHKGQFGAILPDPLISAAVAADLHAVTDPRTHPTGLGIALVESSAVLVGASAWLLPATTDAHRLASIIAAVMAMTGVLFAVATRHNRHRFELLGYPLIVFAGLAVRFGGDEFLVQLPATTVDDAAAIVARIRANWASERGDVTFSAGLAPVRRGRDGSDAFDAADTLLYQAKAAGRNQCAVPAAHATATPPAAARRTSVETMVPALSR